MYVVVVNNPRGGVEVYGPWDDDIPARDWIVEYVSSPMAEIFDIKKECCHVVLVSAPLK